MEQEDNASLADFEEFISKTNRINIFNYITKNQKEGEGSPNSKRLSQADSISETKKEFESPTKSIVDVELRNCLTNELYDKLNDCSSSPEKDSKKKSESMVNNRLQFFSQQKPYAFMNEAPNCFSSQTVSSFLPKTNEDAKLENCCTPTKTKLNLESSSFIPFRARLSMKSENKEVNPDFKKENLNFLINSLKPDVTENRKNNHFTTPIEKSPIENSSNQKKVKPFHNGYPIDIFTYTQTPQTRDKTNYGKGNNFLLYSHRNSLNSIYFNSNQPMSMSMMNNTYVSNYIPQTEIYRKTQCENVLRFQVSRFEDEKEEQNNKECREQSEKGKPCQKEKDKMKKRVEERNGDWDCYKCKNLNFSFRKRCNRCNTTKEESDSYFIRRGDEMEVQFLRPHYYEDNKIVWLDETLE